MECVGERKSCPGTAGIEVGSNIQMAMNRHQSRDVGIFVIIDEGGGVVEG